MAKARTRRPTLRQTPRGSFVGADPEIVRTSLYLPKGLYEAVREAAFRERVKINDIVIEGIEMAARKRGWRR